MLVCGRVNVGNYTSPMDLKWDKDSPQPRSRTWNGVPLMILGKVTSERLQLPRAPVQPAVTSGHLEIIEEKRSWIFGDCWWFIYSDSIVCCGCLLWMFGNCYVQVQIYPIHIFQSNILYPNLSAVEPDESWVFKQSILRCKDRSTSGKKRCGLGM